MPRSQKQIILNHLSKKPITAFYAFESLGITNLSGRIAELRQDGYHIRNEWAEAPNRFGEQTRFVRYHLVNEPRA